MTEPPSGSVAAAAQVKAVLVSIPLFGVMLATVEKVGGEFTTVTVLAMESAPESLSVAVAVQRILSVGETSDGLKVKEDPVPMLVNVVTLYHAYDHVTVPPSGSEAVPVQVNVAEVLGEFGEILTLVATGGVFPMVAEALLVPVPEFASVAVTRQMICSPGSKAL